MDAVGLQDFTFLYHSGSIFASFWSARISYSLSLGAIRNTSSCTNATFPIHLISDEDLMERQYKPLIQNICDLH